MANYVVYSGENKKLNTYTQETTGETFFEGQYSCGRIDKRLKGRGRRSTVCGCHDRTATANGPKRNPRENAATVLVSGRHEPAEDGTRLFCTDRTLSFASKRLPTLDIGGYCRRVVGAIFIRTSQMTEYCFAFLRRYQDRYSIIYSVTM